MDQSGSKTCSNWAVLRSSCSNYLQRCREEGEQHRGVQDLGTGDSGVCLLTAGPRSGGGGGGGTSGALHHAGPRTGLPSRSCSLQWRIQASTGHLSGRKTLWLHSPTPVSLPPSRYSYIWSPWKRIQRSQLAMQALVIIDFSHKSKINKTKSLADTLEVFWELCFYNRVGQYKYLIVSWNFVYSE